MLLLMPGALHYTRCLLSCGVRVSVWLWVWAWVCVSGTTAQGVGVRQRNTLQNFPIAAEENHYSFNPDGTYTFSYDTGGGEHQSFRIEMRDASGRVSGRYGYVDPSGNLRITEYQADSSGYRANVEVYHQVSLAPPEPLVVGPLPKEPDFISDPPEDSPQPSVIRPVGPSPFFPPEQPVLIIGPLPKPLQPQSIEDDRDDSPYLNEDSVFTIPSDPQIPAVLPSIPVRDRSSRSTLNSQQGTEEINTLQRTFIDSVQQSNDDSEILQNSNDILQVSFDDLDVFQNNVVTASTSTPLENTAQLRESQADLRNTGQTSAPTNIETKQKLTTLSTFPVNLLKHKNVSPSTTNLEKVNYSTNNDLQSLAISTSSIPPGMTERNIQTETVPLVAASSPFVAKRNENTRTQTKMSDRSSVHSSLPRIYLPVGVGASRHQYATAPLLLLPQDTSIHPA